VLPLFETFRDAESYYATLAHETTHWTAHESRLARDFGTKHFGSEGYTIEELVAELCRAADYAARGCLKPSIAAPGVRHNQSLSSDYRIGRGDHFAPIDLRLLRAND